MKLKKAKLLFVIFLIFNVTMITCINMIKAQLASASYGEVKITIADVIVNNRNYGQQFVEYAKRGTDVASVDLGESGWSVGWSGPYLLSNKPFYKVQYTQPIIELVGYESKIETINGTEVNVTYAIYNETEYIYEFYFWSIGYDVYMRTNAEVWAEVGTAQKAKAWDFYYTYFGWNNFKFYDYLGTQHEIGYITYTPWNLYAGAGALQFDLQILVELTPFTFGVDVINDTYYFENSWAGLMSADIVDFNSGLIENLGADEYQKISEAQNWEPQANTNEYDGDPEPPTVSVEQLANAYETTGYDLSSYNLGLVDPNPTLTADTTDLEWILQSYQANRDTLSTLMYQTDLSTQIQEREFNADLELTNAPSKAILKLRQTLKPLVIQYNNRLSYVQYWVNMTEYDGFDTYIIENPESGYGDKVVVDITNFGTKSITYPRSIVAKNVFARYTFNITYAQIFNYSKSDIKRVKEGEAIVPTLVNTKLNETDMLTDNFLEDLSGGEEQFIDLPPPNLTHEEATEQSPIEQVLDDYLEYLRSPAGIMTTIFTIVIIAIVIYLILKVIIAIYMPKPPKYYPPPRYP